MSHHLSPTASARRRLMLALVLGLIIPAFSWAGPSQPGRRGGGDARRTSGPAKSEPAVSAELDGTLRGYIQRFTPSKDDADEELLGYLSFKPLDGKTKAIKLAVRKTEDVKIGLTEHPFAPEEATEYLFKGLFCTATWQPNRDPKNKAVKRELKDLVLDTIDVEGKIDQLADDSIIIKGRPKDGDWPAVEGSSSVRTVSNAPKMASQKKIKLKVIEEVTKYSDPNDTPLEASEFEKGQSIDATIVYGKNNQGIIVSLRTPGPRTAKAIAPEPTRGGPPPPRGDKGGRKPIGGG